jgi:hypothetical protein
LYNLISEDSTSSAHKQVSTQAYLSQEEMRIYKTEAIDLLSTYVAKELSKLFTVGAEEAFTFLASLFGVSSEDELMERLKQHHIDISESLPDGEKKDVNTIPSLEAEPEASKKPKQSEV